MFYSIKESMDIKIVGKYFQSENIAYNYGDDPKFLNNVYFKKIDFTPITPILILHKKAKITDLISNVNGGSGTHLVMSEKLKSIIEKYRTEGLQFFKTSIVKDNIEFDNYFSLNMYEFNYEYVDFAESKIIYNRKADDYKVSYNTIKEQIHLENYEELEKKRLDSWVSREEIIFIESLNLFRENVNEDFFMLGHVFGSLYFVSEKLKKEIEDAGCTGIEFQPVELSLYEWTAPGGERERIYGKL